MPTEITVGIAFIVAAILTFWLVAWLMIAKREPKEKFFKCSRCGATTRHTKRTIEAWRNKKTRFFCQACHARWLESQPPRLPEQFSPGRASSGSGCVVVIVVFALVPPGYLLWAYSWQ